MHCNGIVHTFANNSAWKQSLIVETISYWAVPVFFMLSGATLMNYRKKYNTKTFIKKRLIKTLIPFIIWSILVFSWKYTIGTLDISRFSFSDILSFFINSKIESVYWFFIPLFAFYLCIPVLSLLAEKRRILWYMLVCALLTYSILPLAFNLAKITYNSSLYFPLAGGYIIFGILGYLLSTTEIEKKIRICIYIFGLLCILLRYLSTYFLSINENSLNTTFWGYTNLPSVGLAVAVFVWFKYQKWDWISRNTKLAKLVQEISSASFGIYLIHMIIMRLICDWLDVDIYRMWWRTIGALLVYVIALLITKIIQKIPILKYLVP